MGWNQSDSLGADCVNEAAAGRMFQSVFPHLPPSGVTVNLCHSILVWAPPNLTVAGLKRLFPPNQNENRCSQNFFSTGSTMCRNSWCLSLYMFFFRKILLFFFRVVIRTIIMSLQLCSSSSSKEDCDLLKSSEETFIFNSLMSLKCQSINIVVINVLSLSLSVATPLSVMSQQVFWWTEGLVWCHSGQKCRSGGRAAAVLSHGVSADVRRHKHKPKKQMFFVTCSSPNVSRIHQDFCEQTLSSFCFLSYSSY